jgi:sugar lactone lactonase YvrE
MKKSVHLTCKLFALIFSLTGVLHASSSHHSKPVVDPGVVWEQVLLATDLPKDPPLTPNVWPSPGANFGIAADLTADKRGNLYITDITIPNFIPAPGPNAVPNLALSPNGIIWKYDPRTKTTTRFLQPTGMASGLNFDRKGRLITADGPFTTGYRDVRSYNVKTKEFKVLASDYPAGSGNKLVGPNDVTINLKTGVIYFTDVNTVGTNSGPNAYVLPMAVYRIDRDGSLHQIITNLSHPNGIEISPDGRTLYVADEAAPNFPPNSFSPLAAQGYDAFGFNLASTGTGSFGGGVVAYRLNRRGEIVDRKGNVSLENSNSTVGKLLITRNNVRPDGMTLDTEGNIYTAWYNGGFPGAGPINGWVGEITVINKKGRLIANLTPQLATIPPISGIPNTVISPINQANIVTGSISFGKGRYKHTLYLGRGFPWGVYSIETNKTGFPQ